MRIYLLLLCCTGICCQVAAQSINPMNERDTSANARVAYIGMENTYVIPDNCIFVKAVPGNGTQTVANDTLTLRPTQPGRLVLLFKTPAVEKEIGITVKRLPDFVSSLTIRRQRIEITGNAPVFENYRIDSCIATLGGKIFYISGNELPRELMAAADKKPAESRIRFSYIHAKAKTSGREITFQGNPVWLSKTE